MKFEIASDFAECIGKLQKEIGGKVFFNIEDKSALGGVIVSGYEYDDEKIFSIINKFRKKWKIEFKHLIISEDIILLQFTRGEKNAR